MRRNGDQPVVFATGNTVTRLCNEYRVWFPDGHQATIYAVEPRDARDEMSAVMEKAREMWVTRRQYRRECRERLRQYVAE